MGVWRGAHAKKKNDVLQSLAHIQSLYGQRDATLAALDRVIAVRRLGKRVREVTGTDVTLIGLFENVHDIVLRNWAGTLEDGLHDLVIPAGYGLASKALNSRRPAWARDYVSASTFAHDLAVDRAVRAEGLHGMLAVPMTHGNDVLGVIYVSLRRPANFGDASIRQVLTLASGAAFAVHLADRVDARTNVAVQSERHRVATLLHDSVGASLFAIGTEVRDLGETSGISSAMREQLVRIENQIAEASTALRQSMSVLSETAPEDDLAVALADDTQAFEGRTGIPAKLIVLGAIPALGPAHKQALLAVTREGLLNVEKHARARSVVVSLSAAERQVDVAVADDGQGWMAEPGSCAKPGAAPRTWGLEAATARLERLGGRLSVVENDDVGLTLRAWIPLP